MGYWEKTYADGTRLIADDRAVERKEASWRKSRNEGIVKVYLVHKKMSICIEGPGEYWQSDTFEADLLSNKSRLVKRRIMKRIEEGDQIVLIRKEKNSMKIEFHKHVPKKNEKARIVNEALVGQWIVMEMNVVSKQLYSYFSNEKI